MNTKKRISQISKVKQGGCQLPGGPLFVKLYPELSVAALRAGLDKELALWYELRAINSSGSSNPGQQWSSGRLLLNETLAALVKYFGYSEATAYRLLKAGDGKLWDIYQTPWLPGLSQVKIKGLEKVAEYLNTRVGRPVEVRAADFKGRRAKTAWLYASFFKPDGVRAKPISRDSIEAATGVKRRRQQRYDKVAGIKRVANFACYQDGQGKLVPWLKTVFSFCKKTGKCKQWQKHRRLGNTYRSRALKAHKGMTKRVNAELQWSFNSDEARLPKRFFLTPGSLIRSSVRDNEAFLLVNKRDRLIKGRMEWCMA
ncbi:hypothetical protein ES705_21019 [subsurface metagenome]